MINLSTGASIGPQTVGANVLKNGHRAVSKDACTRHNKSHVRNQRTITTDGDTKSCILGLSCCCEPGEGKQETWVVSGERLWNHLNATGRNYPRAAGLRRSPKPIGKCLVRDIA